MNLIQFSDSGFARVALVLTLSLGHGLTLDAARGAESSAPATGAVNVSTASASASAPASGSISLLPEERKKLLSEFKRAQSNEERAFSHQQKSQLRELSAAQNQKSKSWHETEKRARRDFFAQHKSGPDRRKYVQDYIQRKKDFEKSIRNEYAEAKKSWRERQDRLKAKQKQQAALFKAQVDQGVRPDASLWPN